MKRIAKFFKSIPEFFRSIILELKLVEWWSLSQVVKSTIIVTVTVTIFVIVLLGMDKVLVALRSLLLNRPVI